MLTDSRPSRIRQSGCLFLGICLLSASAAQAEFSSGPESRGNWYLAFGLAGGGGVDDTKIAADDCDAFTVDSRLCSGENFEYGLLQLDLRVFTPQQIDIPGKPRFFVRGGVVRKFGKDVAVKLEPVSDSVFIQSARAKQDGFIWDAGLGVAFPFRWREQPLQVEVSVNYGQEPLKARARYADDDAGKFKFRDEIDLSFIKQMIEVTGPIYQRGVIQLEGVVGSYVQFTVSNEKSRQKRSRVAEFRYEKDVGFGAFVGLRVLFGREPSAP